jgi:hypothetical protein
MTGITLPAGQDTISVLCIPDIPVHYIRCTRRTQSFTIISGGQSIFNEVLFDGIDDAASSPHADSTRFASLFGMRSRR